MAEQPTKRRAELTEKDRGCGDLSDAPLEETQALGAPTEKQSDETKKRCTDLKKSSMPFCRLTPNDREALEKRFFLAVNRGQLANIEGYLDSGLPVDTKEEHGSTSLHIATHRRYTSIQQLLLELHSDPNAKDRLGRTPVHMAADNGDVDSIKLFIAYGGKVNAKDKAGNSPLHCAVSVSHEDTIDVLVFCGADGSQRNVGGMSPLQLSASRKIARKVQTSMLTADGRKRGKIKIQTKSLATGHRLYLDEVDVHIEVLEALQKPLGFLCRRSEPEYSPWNLRDQGKELLLSDTFEYILTDTATSTLDTLLQFPVYEKEESYEILYLKTDKGEYIGVSGECNRKIPGKDIWRCDVRVDLKRMSGFVLITYPKVERIDVGSHSVSFKSSVDPDIKLNVPANTFEEGAVNLQVLPCVWYRPEEYQSIVSLSFFYDVSHSQQKQPKETVTMTTPYPADYHLGTVDSGVTWGTNQVETGEERFDSQSMNISSEAASVSMDTDQLVIFTTDADCDTEIPEEKWQILPSKLDKARGRISFDVKHFSIKVPVQLKRGSSLKQAKKDLSQLHKRSIKREHTVVFLGLLKPISETTFQLAVECTVPRKVRKRLKYWVDELAFVDQKPSATGEFRSIPSTEYVISLSSNVKFSHDARKSEVIMFQPKGCHYQTMKIELPNYRRLGFKPTLENTQNTVMETNYHKVDASPKIPNDSALREDKENTPDTSIAVSKREPIEPEHGDEMSGEVYFTEKENSQANIAQLVLFLKGLKKQTLTNAKSDGEDIDDFNGFTCNTFLREISSRMTTEWRRIGVRLGIPAAEVKRISTSNEEPTTIIFKMLVYWREVTKQKHDLGVPNLLKALENTGKAEIAEYVIERLKEWNNSSNKLNSCAAFDKWLKANIDHLGSNVNKDSPEPLSDLFFVVITEMLGVCWPIFFTLELTMVEVEHTRMNSRLTDPYDQIVQLFQQWISKHKKSGDTFINLLDAIDENKGQSVVEDVVGMTQRWLDGLDEPHDSYANEIKAVLQSYDV